MSEEKPKRGRGGPNNFNPSPSTRFGQPGGPPPNCGGKPRVAYEVRKYCQDKSLEAAQILWGFVLDVKLPVHERRACIREIFDRGLGKPLQAVAVTGEDGGPVKHQHNIDAFLDQLRLIRKRKEETEIHIIEGQLANGHDKDA